MACIRSWAGSGPILTDSGGFQVFSLSDRNQVTDQGVTFRSHLDGSILELTPERAIAIQEKLGADVAMCLDHCPRLPAAKEEIAAAVEPDDRLGHRVARRRTDVPIRPSSASSRGAPCGSSCSVRRGACRSGLRRLRDRGRERGRGAEPGTAGSAGDDTSSSARSAALPDGRRPSAGYSGRCRHRGRPVRLRDADAKWAKCNLLFRKRIRKITQRLASGRLAPIDENCTCLACREFSRSYLRHLFLAREMLGPILATIHNLTFLHRLTSRIREAIALGRFVQLRLEVLEALGA